MVTRKLKFFEYSGKTADFGQASKDQHIYHTFDTPNGQVFIVAGNNLTGEPGASLSKVAVERVRYYLNNEVPDKPIHAARNALMYANGFVHVMSARTPDVDSAELSCLCIIIREREVYYAWVGQVCLYLMADKRLVQLSSEIYREQTGPEHGKPWELAFLGKDKVLSPGVSKQPFIPASDDQLLLGTGGVCLTTDEKLVKKVLSDSMPTNTKATRLIRSSEEEELPAACLMIQFYNLGSDERSFVAAEKPRKKAHELATKGKDFFVLSNPTIRYTLFGLAAIILGWMVYDMFFINPRPGGPDTLLVEDHDLDPDDHDVSSESVTISQQGPAPDRSSAATADDDRTSTQWPAFPADVTYTVRRGDTWGRIYREFRVCSWFIRQHPSNQGKFDADNNPVAGTEIVVPVRYSASQNLNPDYYSEFTIDKVGSSCQHASQAFIEQFEQRLRERQN